MPGVPGLSGTPRPLPVPSIPWHFHGGVWAIVALIDSKNSLARVNFHTGKPSNRAKMSRRSNCSVCILFTSGYHSQNLTKSHTLESRYQLLDSSTLLIISLLKSSIVQVVSVCVIVLSLSFSLRKRSSFFSSFGTSFGPLLGYAHG